MEIGIDSFAKKTQTNEGGNVADDAQAMSELIERIEHADKVGLDVFGIGEHHREEFLDSAAHNILSAAASRTKNIKLTSAVAVISAMDPVRLFQNYATLDLVSNGRAEIIAGRGSFTEAFELFGYKMEQYDELFEEKLELLIEIQKNENKQTDTIEYRNSSIFVDSRNKKLGARILSTLEKLHLTIKKLGLKIVKPEIYFKDAHALGVPVKGVESLKEQLFGLEANFEELKAIDFKKGCYIGQENTARMKLKNKLRRRLLPISSTEKLNLGEEIFYDKIKIGKILIEKPYPFGLVKLIDPNVEEFQNKELLVNNKKCKILKSV